MQHVATETIGSIDLSKTEVFQFPEGLYGFTEEREFAISQEKQGSPFLWLQSVSNSDLAFVILDPTLILKEEYQPEIAPQELETLQIKSLTECNVYVIVTIPNECPEKMTANLQGPILINEEKRLGRQIISLNSKHEVQFPIMRQLEA